MGAELKDYAGSAHVSCQPTSEPFGLRATAEALSTFIADTTRFIRHYPLGTVAAAFGGGMLVGWLIARDLKTRLSAGNEQRQQQASEEKAKRRAISRWEGEGGRVVFNEERQSEVTNQEA